MHKFSSAIGWVQAKRRRMAVVAALVLSIFSGATVLAYFIATGSGTVNVPSTTPITSPAPVTLVLSVVADSGVMNGSTPESTWSDGYTETYTLQITNPSTNAVTLGNGVTMTGWTSNQPGCDSSSNSGAVAGTFTMTPTIAAMGGTKINPGGGVNSPPLTITFHDLSGVDQSVCAGAEPNFAFAAS